MTITIDNRAGSKELFPLFPKGMAKLGYLQFADLAFLGRGPDEKPVAIGIERKKILDLINSMTSGRLSGYQIPGLINSYDFVYLMVEGLWRPNPENGILERNTGKGRWVTISLGQRTFMAREIYNYIHTLALFRGILLWFTHTPKETVLLTRALFHWWNDKPFSAHGAHLKLYDPFCNLSVGKRSIVQRMAMEIPGIGAERARMASKRFQTVVEMVLASKEEWEVVEGIGKVLSEKIVKYLQERE